MARKKIKKYQVFWVITAVVSLWLLIIVILKVRHVWNEPEKALKEERRHHLSTESISTPSISAVSASTSLNLKNIKDGNFTEKAQWPKVPDQRKVLVPVDNGEEKSVKKDPAKSYYGEQ